MNYGMQAAAAPFSTRLQADKTPVRRTTRRQHHSCMLSIELHNHLRDDQLKPRLLGSTPTLCPWAPLSIASPTTPRVAVAEIARVGVAVGAASAPTAPAWSVRRRWRRTRAWWARRWRRW